MAGRGRGRGRGLSFDVEALGFSRGDALPAPVAEPPPQFPAPLFKPVPLLTGKNYDYSLALKQELRGTFRDSHFFIPPVTLKRDITRYSDKYQQIPAEEQVIWDWSLFPKELREKAKEPRKKKKVNPEIKKSTAKEIDLKEKLNELETKEVTEGDEEPKEESKKNPEEEEEEVENEEVYDDEELEDETDYALDYFDNGENYLDDEDDNLDDGPVY